MLQNTEFFVAIPAFNAARTIGEVIAEVNRHVELDHIIVIDDGSQDNTSAHVPRGVILLNHPRNLGKGAALQSAIEFFLENTRAPSLITLDADKQHAPEEIPKFLHQFFWQQADLVIGARSFEIGKMPFIRILSNTITSWLISRKVKKKIRDSQSGYRLYSRKFLQKLRLTTSGYETESEMLLQAAREGIKIGFVDIATIYNRETSHISGFRDIVRFLQIYLKY